MSKEVFLSKPLSELRGIDYTKRKYFEKGVSDAQASKDPCMNIKGNKFKNTFVKYYKEGYLRTIKLMKKENKQCQ